MDWVDAKASRLNFLLLLFPFLLLSHESGIVTHTFIPVGIYNAGPLGTLIAKKAMLDQKSSSLIYLLTSASHAKHTLSPSSNRLLISSHGCPHRP